VEGAAIGANHHQGDVVGRKILGETFGDFLEKRRDEFFRWDVAKQIDDTEQAFFAEHFAIGIAGFDERVSVADQAVAGIELNIEMFVVGELKNAERNVAGLLLFEIFLVAEQRPAAIEGAKKEWAGMAGVTKREPAAGCEKGGDHGGGEGALAGKRGKLLVEQADELFLVEPIDKAAHEGPQVRCHGGDGSAVAGNIGEQQAADTPGSAARDIVNIAAALDLAERFAIDPDIETCQFDSTRCNLATSPDLHALHVLRGRVLHASIITAESLMFVVAVCAALSAIAHNRRARLLHEGTEVSMTVPRTFSHTKTHVRCGTPIVIGARR
jgi:hypothetical protein